jgi:inhibitor of KinA sporulation pathway (predicted exonuclease)
MEPSERMKNLLIVDLEATCFAHGEEPPDFHPEIIEIGAVLFDVVSRTATDAYRTFVHPANFPRLGSFCTKLTTIQQMDVDAAPPLRDALSGLGRLYDPQRAVFASWGFYDQRQIERECRRLSLPYPFTNDHISLKHNHAAFYSLERPLGMDAALRLHSLQLTGTHHRAQDDARNIACIAACMLADGWSHETLLEPT